MKHKDEVHALMDEITALLSELPREKRLAWFRDGICPKPLDFTKEIDGTRYAVHSFFHDAATESMEEKLNRVLDRHSGYDTM